MLVSRIAERTLCGAASILTVPIVTDSPCRGQISNRAQMEILTVFLNRAPLGAAPACLTMLVNRLQLPQTEKLP